jgi:hypothetical protein
MPLSGWKTYCRVFTSGAALSITDVRWSHRRPARDEATNRMIRSSTRRKQDAKRYLRAGVKTGQFGLPGSGSPRVTDTRICRPFLIRRRCGTRLFFLLVFIFLSVAWLLYCARYFPRITAASTFCLQQRTGVSGRARSGAPRKRIGLRTGGDPTSSPCK